MSVITISRETGSAGTQIVESVAKALGYCFVDKRILGAILSKYGLISFKHVYDNVPDFWEGFDSQKTEQRATTISMMNKALLAIAKRGNAVIVGRGGFVVLAGYDDVFNVRIQAPLEARVKRVQLELKSADYKLAEKDVKEQDRVRDSFMDSVYGIKAEPARAFDLVINTAKITPERAIGWITEAARALDKSAMGGERLVSKLEVDPVLADAVAEVLKG